MFTTIAVYFLILCLAIYTLSMIEVTGSYLLTAKHHGYCLKDNFVFCFCFPPAAPIFALDIIWEAWELYDKNKPNKYHIDESLFGYIAHGFNSIDEWSSKRKRSTELSR